MNKKQTAMLRWLFLAVFLFAAGCFYSCGGKENRAVIVSEGVQETADVEQESANHAEAAEYAGASQEATDFLAEAETMEAGNQTDSAQYYVYVCGEVRSPGVYCLPEGARIYEAVELAGGFTDQAAENWLNLAEPVFDGMKLEVPSKAQASDPSWQEKQKRDAAAGAGNGRSSGESGVQTVLVNLNTATLEELMSLKGIGASRAEDIIRYRKEAGGFTKIEDIMKVPGIKNAAFQKIKENITV